MVRHSGHILAWYCPRCDGREAVFKRSIFEQLKLPLGRALMAIHCFAWGQTYEQTKLACQLTAEQEKLSDHTVGDWFRKLRDRLIDYAAEDAGCKIGGQGMIVQVDEALIGRRKYNRGRVIEGTWVVGLIDSLGQLRLTVTSDRSAASLETILRKHVNPESEIHTDGWAGYRRLKELGYVHKTVNHSAREFVSAEGTHTQRIESQWRNLRRKFSRGGIRHEDIGEHLVEHIWRRQCRIGNKDPFLDILKYLQYEA